MTVKLTLDQVAFLNRNASTIVDGDGNRWQYMPFWIRRIGHYDYELVSFDRIPDSLKLAIQELKESELAV